ncbi:MAG: hypothetical protein U5L45_22735 [Saprospiraceae bacterium]|nr:hypothetical protein [Saprospiraceae bacterium]
MVHFRALPENEPPLFFASEASNGLKYKYRRKFIIHYFIHS